MENPLACAETSMVVQLPVELALELDQWLQGSGQTSSSVIVAALRAYLQTEGQYQRAIEQGVAAAQRNEFVPDEEVHAFFAKYGA